MFEGIETAIRKKRKILYYCEFPTGTIPCYAYKKLRKDYACCTNSAVPPIYFCGDYCGGEVSYQKPNDEQASELTDVNDFTDNIATGAK